MGACAGLFLRPEATSRVWKNDSNLGYGLVRPIPSIERTGNGWKWNPAVPKGMRMRSFELLTPQAFFRRIAYHYFKCQRQTYLL